jgi:hypothetical protein
MERHERWRTAYRASRYMEHLTESEVQQRAKDIFLNLMVLTEENKIGLPPIDAEGCHWMVLWTHILEEFMIRYGPYPAGFENGFITDLRTPRPDSPLATKAAQVVKAADLKELQPGSFLVKYGKYQYLEAMCEAGSIRIAPAASYDDPSLNPAIRDQELELYIQPPPFAMRLEVIDHKTGKPKATFNPIGNKITKSANTNYFVYCLSTVLVPRLFLDFDADACVIITKPKDFIEQLVYAFEKRMPGWTAVGTPVNYIDPLHVRLNALDIFCQKHFRYTYQKEFRAIWLPSEPITKLDPVFVDMGKLADSCRLIGLGKT